MQKMEKKLGMLTQARNVIKEEVQSPKKANTSTFDPKLAEKAKKKVVNLTKGEVLNGSDIKTPSTNVDSVGFIPNKF